MKEDFNALQEPFDIKAVPSWYPVCINGQCPRHQQCMRYQVGKRMPSSLYARLCVMPNAWQNGDCRFFEEIRLVRVARGFTTLYDRVLKHDFTPMRKELVAYFHGRRQYYWYLRGERTLLPEQQEWLRQWLLGWKYDWDFPFDSYEDTYVYLYKDILDKSTPL